MPTVNEIRRAILGSLLIFLGRPQGLSAFDMSFAGFWRSFLAIVPMAPFLAVTLASERLFLMEGMDAADFPTGAFVASRIVAIALEWFGFPVVLALLARLLGFQRGYVPLVVALNWSSLAVALPYSVPHLLHAGGLLGTDVTGFLGLVLLGAMLRLEFEIVRFALGVPVGFAIGLVAVDFLSSLLLDLAVSTAFGVP